MFKIICKLNNVQLFRLHRLSDKSLPPNKLSYYNVNDAINPQPSERLG